MLERSTSTPFIRTAEEGRIGWLVFNRPERRNALNRDMWAAIPKALGALDGLENVRAIVIRGAGEEAFASGADISEFAENRNDAEAAMVYEALNGAAFAAIRATSKPVIAMIHGFCFGGGLAIALACDLRIASDKALFSLPPARLGLAYPLDGLADLLSVVPLAIAKDMIFTARRMDAGEAKAVGLVNRVTSSDELENTIQDLCVEIAAGAPLTIKASKVALDFLAGRPGARTKADIEALMKTCFDSADYAEGRLAFLEKRKPEFTGR